MRMVGQQTRQTAVGISRCGVAMALATGLLTAPPSSAAAANTPPKDTAMQAPPHATDQDAPGPWPHFMRLYSETRGFSLGRPTGVRLTPDGAHVLFLRAPPGRRFLELHEHTVATGETRQLLTPDALLKGAQEQLTTEEKARRERMRISAGGFTGFELSADGRLVLLQLSGKLYTFDRTTRAVRMLPVPKGVVLDPQFSPNASSVAYVRNHELCVLELARGKERCLTQGGSTVLRHGEAEFVAQEEMDRMHGYFFSPQGSTLAYQETQTTDVEPFYIHDPLHPEVAPVEFRYPRAGRNNAVVRLGVVPAAGGTTAWVDWDAKRYPYLARVVWASESTLSLVVQSRDQRSQALLGHDVKTGKTSVLLEETDAAWLNLPAGPFPRWLAGGKRFLWMTERNGGWELELRNADGALTRTVVPLTLNLRELAAVDETAGHVYVLGGADPTSNVLYRVGLEQDATWQVPGKDGLRSVQFNDKATVFVETLGSRTHMRTTRIVLADGTVKGALPAATVQPPFAPNVTWQKVGEGAGFHTVVIRPRRFDPARQYPVMLMVYAGPRHNVVVSTQEAYLREQWVADHGYVVVSVDGRGTQWRGRAWERAIAGDLASVPLADQVAGLKLLAQTVPQMDLDRVGVMGWSFGGYMSALAVLRRPDVFHTAVAGAPVTDWQDYDTHYTERYLGLPSQAPQAYNSTSLLGDGPRLERPLLLVHGTADDNVYFLHTLKLSHALTLAGKPHTVLPLAGATHMVPDPAMVEALWDRMLAFLSQTLMPAPPR